MKTQQDLEDAKELLEFLVSLYEAASKDGRDLSVAMSAIATIEWMLEDDGERGKSIEKLIAKCRSLKQMIAQRMILDN